LLSRKVIQYIQGVPHLILAISQSYWFVVGSVVGSGTQEAESNLEHPPNVHEHPRNIRRKNLFVETKSKIEMHEVSI